MTFKRAPERFADAHPDAGVTTRSPTLPPPTTRRSPFTVLRDAHAEDDADDSISDG